VNSEHTEPPTLPRVDIFGPAEAARRAFWTCVTASSALLGIFYFAGALMLGMRSKFYDIPGSIITPLPTVVIHGALVSIEAIMILGLLFALSYGIPPISRLVNKFSDWHRGQRLSSLGAIPQIFRPRMMHFHVVMDVVFFFIISVGALMAASAHLAYNDAAQIWDDLRDCKRCTAVETKGGRRLGVLLVMNESRLVLLTKRDRAELIKLDDVTAIEPHKPSPKRANLLKPSEKDPATKGTK